jgi:hypothetical protein
VEFVSLFILKSILTKELTKMRAEFEHVTNIIPFFIGDYDVVYNHNISLSLPMVEACVLGDILHKNEYFKKKYI